MSKSTKRRSENRNRCSVKKYIRFEYELLNAVNSNRSETESFSAWVKCACRDKLSLDITHGREQDEAVTTNIELHKLDIAIVFEMHEKGLFNQQIADALNEKGIEPQNGAKQWTRVGVSKILKALL